MNKDSALTLIGKLLDSQNGPLLLALVILGFVIYSSATTANLKLDQIVAALTVTNSKLEKITAPLVSLKGNPDGSVSVRN